MIRRLLGTVAGVSVLAAVLYACDTAAGGTDKVSAPPTPTTVPRGSPDPMLDVQYASAYQTAHVEEAVDGLVRQAADYAAWVADQERLAYEAEQAALAAAREQQAREDAAAAAAAQASRSRPAQPAAGVSSGGGGGSCYGGPVPDYIVTRESGGNPGAVNASSGAYGCYQIMPYVWSANCSDLSRDVAGQRECASRISNGGSNLAPWSG